LESVLIVVIGYVVVMLCCFSISIDFGWNHDDNCCYSTESVLIWSGDSIEVVKVLASAPFSWF
jgi:hypothetical protein